MTPSDAVTPPKPLILQEEIIRGDGIAEHLRITSPDFVRIETDADRRAVLPGRDHPAEIFANGLTKLTLLQLQTLIAMLSEAEILMLSHGEDGR